MTLQAFLDRVIDDGIKACRESYKDDPPKRDGAVAGFNSCRGKTVLELRKHLELARGSTHNAHRLESINYWVVRCFELEVEWVCNVVSAALQNEGLDVIVIPTARGYMKAAEILGVRDSRIEDLTS